MTDFNTQQIKILKKLFAHSPMTTGLGIPEKFLLQYVLFEALTRLVGSNYRNRVAQRKKSTTHESLKIDVVKRSFKHFSIRVSDERLNLLLNSKLTKKDEKSARKLRDGLVHQWKAEDVQEVIKRYGALSNALIEVSSAIEARVH